MQLRIRKLIFSRCPRTAPNLFENLKLTRVKVKGGDCVQILIGYKLCIDSVTIWIEVYNNKLEQNSRMKSGTVNDALCSFHFWMSRLSES